MDLINQLILLGSLLVLLSIFAGLLSTRLGVPLLLVFLGLGMLAGEDGPGGIRFDDFQLTYLVGSCALALILFDGGLRTPRANLRLALWPALALATVGVLATALLTGAFAMWVLRLGWLTHVRKIVLPSAVPMMFTGLRVSLGIAWMVLIAAEMLAQNPGLGKFVWDQFQNGSSQSLGRIMVAVFTIGFIGFLLDRVMHALQRLASFGEATH